MTSLAWDPLHMVGTTLSNSNRTATVDNNANLGGQGGVRGNIGYQTGKHRYEFKLNVDDPTSPGLPATGGTDQTGTSFPGNPGQGVGFYNNAYLLNSTEGGTWGSHGTAVSWVLANVFISAGPRYCVAVDSDAGLIDIISLLAPQGTHTAGGTGGHDAIPAFVPGQVWYPNTGCQFGNGADHSYTVTIYGDLADFTIPCDPSYLPWSTPSSGFFALL